MTIEIGAKAPPFELPSSEGGTLSLAQLRGRYVVLYFYPKDNTPGCTTEALAFEAARPRLDALGATVVGVSKDSIASHCRFRDKHSLGFALLSDESGEMLERYGAWGPKKLYGREFLGIIRSTVVIGPKGEVVAHFPKVRVKGHDEAVIAAIEAHRASS